jgi:hypothetical protein
MWNTHKGFVLNGVTLLWIRTKGRVSIHFLMGFLLAVTSLPLLIKALLLIHWLETRTRPLLILILMHKNQNPHTCSHQEQKKSNPLSKLFYYLTLTDIKAKGFFYIDSLHHFCSDCKWRLFPRLLTLSHSLILSPSKAKEAEEKAGNRKFRWRSKYLDPIFTDIDFDWHLMWFYKYCRNLASTTKKLTTKYEEIGNISSTSILVRFYWTMFPPFSQRPYNIIIIIRYKVLLLYFNSNTVFSFYNFQKGKTAGVYW